LLTNLLISQQAYIDVDFDIASEFLHVSTNYFGGKPERIEFDRSDEAVKRINAWVEHQTRGKIRDLLVSGSVGAGTRLVLVNAVYFRAGWLHPFEPNKTEMHNFTLPGGHTVDVEMMELEAGQLNC
jgi:serine protease inhibitor